MGICRPKPLFYLVVKDVRTRPHYKSKTLTVYANGVPQSLDRFMPWLKKAIEGQGSEEK